MARRIAVVLALLCVAAVAQLTPASPITFVTAAPSGACTPGEQMQYRVSTGVLYSCQSSTWAAIGATSGTVSSVGLALPNIFTITVSPITSSGTLTATLATQAANRIFSGPATGADAAPTFRALAVADIPAGVDAAKLNGTSFAGTSGNLVAFGAANIPADSSIATATVVKGAAALDTAGYVPYVSSAGTLAIDATAANEFFWDASAHALCLGCNVLGATRMQLSVASGASLWGVSSAALGSSSGSTGAFFTSLLPDAADRRLGAFLFGYLNGTTARNSVAMEAYSSQAWVDNSHQGSYIQFAITPNDTNGRAAVLKLDNSTTANDIRMLVYDVSAGALVRATRGAADSGGSGFRVLRIPN